MLTSSLSGSVLWVKSSGIRVGSAIRAKKTRGSRVARGQPPLRRVLARAGMSHVRILRRFHQWLRLFLLYTVVWSKHNFDNFYFLAKIKHHFKPYALIPICWWEKPLVVALIPIVGDFCSPLRNGGVHDHCSKEAKHTDTIFNVVRQIAYIHERDRYY